MKSPQETFVTVGIYFYHFTLIPLPLPCTEERYNKYVNQILTKYYQKDLIEIINRFKGEKNVAQLSIEIENFFSTQLKKIAFLKINET